MSTVPINNSGGFFPSFGGDPLNPYGQNISQMINMSTPQNGFQMAGGQSAVPAFNPGQIGFNIPTLNMGLSGLSTIAGLIGGFQSMNLAKKQFNFTKGVTETNLTNSVNAYNTALDDKIRSRAIMEGQTEAQASAYFDKHKAQDLTKVK